MTALQDWLSISPVTPQTVKSFVWGFLRTAAPAAPVRREPKAMRRGLERC